MVPQMINVVHEYVRDSIAYLKGLINHGDILTTACQHRDKMIKVKPLFNKTSPSNDDL